MLLESVYIYSRSRKGVLWLEHYSSDDGCCSEESSASLSELVSADSTCTSGMKALLSFFLQESQIRALIEI